ncbi:MAG: hypothetical protein EHM62_01970 [Methylococcus sp.]|nr:MAG: hypothetical protein EHM62_01970 [Methylococcus sp.]
MSATGEDVRLSLENVRRTIDDLTARRQSREKELLAMRLVISAPPVVFGGALVIPATGRRTSGLQMRESLPRVRCSLPSLPTRHHDCRRQDHRQGSNHHPR